MSLLQDDDPLLVDDDDTVTEKPDVPKEQWGLQSWKELEYFDIRVQEQTVEQFFGSPLPESVPGPRDFANVETISPDLDDSSLALFKRLQFMIGWESCDKPQAVQFILELLRALEYEKGDMLLQTSKFLQLRDHHPRLHDFGVDITLQSGFSNEDQPELHRMIAQVESTHNEDGIARVVAGAIAAFQEDCSSRRQRIGARVIPAISFAGFAPEFYKIRVTTELDHGHPI
ncbi:hypothetical protein AX16_010171 [Volvariella volvacea WC 439]|nr:hypothetical protein AX16_010171 [Volvariella volvacea WC 439]